MTIEIRIEGPGKNALGSTLISNINEKIDAASGAPILFTGAGDAFSAGLDLKEVASLDDQGMASFLERLESFFRKVWLYPGPTVAAVNGHAIAGGCILAMCCDYTVATNDKHARIGLNEVAIGLRFPPGLLNFVRAVIPAHHLSQVVLGAKLHGPTEALRLGIVDAVSENPHEDAEAMLARLAKHPAQAYAATKQDIRSNIMKASPEAQAAFVRDVVPFWTSPALKAMIRSLLGN